MDEAENLHSLCKEDKEPWLMFSVFWKFPPSATSSCFISHSFNKDTLPQAARRGPISYQFKHDHDILVPQCLHRKSEQSAERIPPASLLLQMSPAVFMCIYRRCRIPRVWKVQVMAQCCRAKQGQQICALMKPNAPTIPPALERRRLAQEQQKTAGKQQSPDRHRMQTDSS